MNLKKNYRLETTKEIALIIFSLFVANVIGELLIEVSVFLYFLILNDGIRLAISKTMLTLGNASYEVISISIIVQNIITIIVVYLFLNGNIRSKINSIKININYNGFILFIYGVCLAFIAVIIITIIGVTSGMSKLNALGFITFHQFIQVFIITVITYLSVGFGEEIFFRGYILNKLLESANQMWAVVVGAFIFMLFHIGTYSKVLDFIDVFLAGIALSYMYIVFESLWFSIGFHFMWDFTQSFLVKIEEQVIVNHAILEFSVPKDIYVKGINIGCELEIIFIIVDLIVIVFMIFIHTKKSKLRFSV